MKKINIWYWVFTGLFTLAMAWPTITGIIADEKSIEFFKHMQQPAYMVRFLGFAKLFGLIFILIPGLPRLKEWAYAGLFFDLLGAVYGLLAVGNPIASMLPMLVYFILFAGSYYFYHRKLKVQGAAVTPAMA